MAADKVDIDRRARLVDRASPRRSDELEAVACGAQDAVEGLDRRVRALGLELGDRGLADAEAGRELGLGKARGAAGVADEEIWTHPGDYNLEVIARLVRRQ